MQIAEYIVHEVEKDGLDFTLALMQKIYDIFKVAVEKRAGCRRKRIDFSYRQAN